MILKITDDCMSCGMCADECPTYAITPAERKGGYAQYQIDTDKCVGCMNCMDICPANAITKIREKQDGN